VSAASLPPDVEIAAGWDACMASIIRSRERRNVWLATVRFDTHSGLNSDITAPPKSADTVAKVFSGQQTKIIKTADAFRRRRREGPHRFAQKRPRTFVSGLPSIGNVETSKHRLLRDFQRRSIFDFCNSICHKRKSRIIVDLAREQRQQLMLGSVKIAGAGVRFCPHDQVERRQAQSRCADVDKRQAAPPGADCS
jgi:hypothetical protein